MLSLVSSKLMTHIDLEVKGENYYDIYHKILDQSVNRERSSLVKSNVGR